MLLIPVYAVAPPFSGMLDALGVSAVRAYSMRRLRGGYAGSAIRIRRSSDNAEQDIGFSGENLNTAAISSFVGANSAYIAKWYDQSGNGDDAIRATAANQPRIVNAGTLDTRNSLPAAVFIKATPISMVSSSSFSVIEASALAAVNSSTPWPSYGGVFEGNNNGENEDIGIVGNQGAAAWLTGGSFAFPTISVDNTGSSNTVFSGVLQQVAAYGAAGAATWGAATIGIERAVTDSDHALDGWISEIVGYSTALSSGNRSAQYTNQKTYWGTP